MKLVISKTKEYNGTIYNDDVVIFKNKEYEEIVNYLEDEGYVYGKEIELYYNDAIEDGYIYYALNYL